MKTFKTVVWGAARKFGKDESGQDLIEYTLLMAFIALASAAIVASAGTGMSNIWKSTSNTISNAAAALPTS